ncbi:MAG: ABC transporter permease subunit [Gammaproteobacteria bacterium]
MMIFTIAAREIKSLFLSPLAWAILAVVQLILAYVFLIGVDQFLEVQPRLSGLPDAPGVTDIVAAPLFGTAAVVLLLVAPLLTMRLVSEEHRNRTLSLLLSAPVSMTEIILGKYLGILFFMLVMLGMVAAMPLSLLMGGHLDLGKLAGGVFGLGLLLAAFSAAGLFMSTLTTQPTVAAISTFGLLLLLWIIDWTSGARAEVSGVLNYLSLTRHYEPLLRGMFNSVDVVYYLLFIAAFLALAVRRLDAERLQH